VLVTLCVMVVGLTMYASLIGNLTSAFGVEGKKERELASKMESVNEYMHGCDMPPELQMRVRGCYEYMFATGWHTAGTTVLNDLPLYMYNEVLFFINRDVISKVPLFRECKAGFVKALVPFLKPQALMPTDHLMCEGELGEEM
jgi:hypothetical protein